MPYFSTVDSDAVLNLHTIHMVTLLANKLVYRHAVYASRCSQCSESHRELSDRYQLRQTWQFILLPVAGASNVRYVRRLDVDLSMYTIEKKTMKK